MWVPEVGVRVYVAVGHTDMRKSINGLSLLVEDVLAADPFSGHVFVFSHRRRRMVKVLYWDGTGFCLWQKRLERGRFRWPETEGAVAELSARELRWLLEGLEPYQPQAHERLWYTTAG